MSRIEARWVGADDSSEHLVLHETAERIVVDSVFISSAAENFAVRYQIVLDPEWRVRDVTVELLGNPDPFRISADGLGNWFDVEHQPLPRFRGAIDIDLTITCFTNSLPVRRLRLQPGQQAEIITVYFALPDLTPFPDPQRYTCIEPNRYRFDSLDSDFTREITFDDHDLVLDYPGLFRRVNEKIRP